MISDCLPSLILAALLPAVACTVVSYLTLGRYG